MAVPDENLCTRSLDVLAETCEQKTAHYLHGRAHDSSACYEIFRRAILEKSQVAWEVIHRLYQGQVLRWVRRHPSFCYTGEEEGYFVNRALEKLWQAIPAERFFQFPDLRQLLSYLQLCVHSAITDSIRARDQAELESDLLPVTDEDPCDPPEPRRHAAQLPSIEQRVEARSQLQAAWRLVAERLRDPKEAKVAYAAFVLDLKPTEMLECYPGQFQGIKEIYRIKENILDRLRRDHDLLQQLRLSTENSAD
jgi:DNA-directed RNA polymerase specialized sigma24 family protein